MKNKDKKDLRLDNLNKEVLGTVILVQFAVILVMGIMLANSANNMPLTETIDYNKIDAIVKKHTSEQVEAADVDYERIEQLMKDNQANVEKDFGDKFEEMTSYFGEKFKNFVDEVNKRLQDNK